jgi:dCMP deaminase
METRPTWEKYFSDLTLLTAKRSACKRLHVGCILVMDNRIIAQGYNGYLPGVEHTPMMRDGHEMGTVHAEQNAIADCAKRGVSCNKCTAYITHYPCINCMKILCAAGISKIKYIHDYHNDELVKYFAIQSNVTIEKLT